MASKKYKGKRVESNRKRAPGRAGSAPRIRLAGTPHNTKRIEPDTTPKIKHSKMSARKAVLIILIILIFSLTTLMITLGFYVSSLDTVFPNIYLDGVRISGKTYPELTDVITRMIESTEFNTVAVTINYYGGEPLTITSDEAGFEFEADIFDVENMTNEIFSIGREGSFLQNELEFIRSLFVITEINLTDLDRSVALMFDEEAVRTMVDEHTYLYNNALVDDALTITEESITIVKGTRLEYADAGYVFGIALNALYEAIIAQNDIALDYSPAHEDGEDVDLDMLFRMIHMDPIDSTYNPETFSTTLSYNGTTFDLEEAREKLGNAVGGDVIVIPIITLLPNPSQKELDAMLLRDTMGEISTIISGSSNRHHNIVLASGFIHETLLNPGEVFSFNEVVGRRLESRGFRMAPGFTGGRLVDQVGGGICQVSSTLYVATLMANLEVVERRPHGQPISYLPLGQDATVAYEMNLNYRFRNNTEFPVRIEMEVSGRTLTAKIIGTRLEDYRIELRSEEISSTPIVVVYQESEYVFEEATERPGAEGKVVDVFKRFYDSNGRFLHEELVGRTTYRMVTRVILVPLPGAEPPPAPAEPPPPPPAPPPAE